MSGSINFGKEVTVDFVASNGARVVMRTDDSHLVMSITNADGVTVEAEVRPLREGASNKDPQYALLLGIESAAQHARKNSLSYRPAPEVAQPARKSFVPKRAKVSDRTRAAQQLHQRHKRMADGARFVLFADENDLSASSADLVLDPTIPLAVTEHGARMIAAKRYNKLRGSQPSTLWTTRPLGEWHVADFDVNVNEYGHYVVSFDPALAREMAA